MENKKRAQTAMVLWQIEMSLGTFVINKGDIESINIDAVENIYKREEEKGRVFKKNSIKDIVEATYLDEVLGFAIDISQEDSLNDAVLYLHGLFHHLDVYGIRNAVSHPNRQFWDVYWYRIAAIASDPIIARLGLSDITKALKDAEGGNIEDPPEEWLQKVIWQIPNNVPIQVDHGLTGLIGRKAEINELKSFIENPRVNTIALIAPGGAGKTALALDLLQGIVATPSFSKFIDAVLYTTMKTEKLTSDGIVSLDSIETMVELKNNITDSINNIFDENYESFEEAVNEKKEAKVLICVDNLETLLRDNQETFEKLNQALPSAWQVLVTSRVAISTATIIKLEVLKENSATHLTRIYLQKRGGVELHNDEYVALAKACFYNPLAIRLTIDLIIAGHDVPTSVDVANKEIAAFSYNNLIGTLSDDAVEILEAVFVENYSTRLSLCELLTKDMDDISSAISDLYKTSLITRTPSEEGEQYSLSDSVRDLLVISPRNIEVRGRVQDSIQGRRALSINIDVKQGAKEVWDPDFLPKDTSDNLKLLISKVNSELRKAKNNTEIAIGLFRQLKEAEYLYKGDTLYHRAFARVSELLKDNSSAEKHYKVAIKGSPEIPSSAYLLAKMYHNTKRYDEAHDIYAELIRNGWTSEETNIVPFARTIYNGKYLALMYSGKYEEILEETKKWKESVLYRGLLGTYRASAWKRISENLISSDERVEALIKSSRIITDVFISDGYFKQANNQAINLIKEVIFFFEQPVNCERHTDEGEMLLQFSAKNIQEIRNADSKVWFDMSAIIQRLTYLQIKGNPFLEQKWQQSTKNYAYEQGKQKEKMSDGSLVAVTVTNRPRDIVNYLFAKDASDQDYFLHYDKLKNGNWNAWTQISVGIDLQVVADNEGPPQGKAISTKEIYLID